MLVDEEADRHAGPASRRLACARRRDGWYVFDDGRHVDVGALKGDKGSQNYPIPDDLDLTVYRSVSIRCERFHVSFGAAQLTD
ncbi:DM13 domain-containing protein [Actinoplanes lobatus]|uniref:DM13 domain-containing protein n=1 Tax=Actinoplanes lobatus TaxID=113568 RepID=A0A7W7HGD8_9ACTN|nr:hypothetical protein [Actinoplanes lobatus]